MSLWPRLRKNGWLRKLFSDKGVVRYYTYSFDQTYKHIIDTWDYQWFFHCWVKNMWEIMPNVNLVTNIGHSEALATHTKSQSRTLNVPAQPIPFPLSHPPEIVLDRQMDQENEADRRFSFLTHTLIKRGKAISRVKGKVLNRFA
jgi:hypothetical protein